MNQQVGKIVFGPVQHDIQPPTETRPPEGYVCDRCGKTTTYPCDCPEGAMSAELQTLRARCEQLEREARMGERVRLDLKTMRARLRGIPVESEYDTHGLDYTTWIGNFIDKQAARCEQLRGERDASLRNVEPLIRERTALRAENAMLIRTLQQAWGYIGRTVSEGPERREIRNAIDTALGNAQEASDANK